MLFWFVVFFFYVFCVLLLIVMFFCVKKVIKLVNIYDFVNSLMFLIIFYCFLWFLELFTVVLILILMIALVWGSWAHFDRSFDCARPLCSRDSSIDISLPIWPSKFIVPMAFAVLCARLVLQATGYSRAFWLNLERPVAVPLIQSIAAQARAEAEALDNFK